jgi:hypothetical protein
VNNSFNNSERVFSRSVSMEFKKQFKSGPLHKSSQPNLTLIETKRGQKLELLEVEP